MGKLLTVFVAVIFTVGSSSRRNSKWWHWDDLDCLYFSSKYNTCSQKKHLVYNCSIFNIISLYLQLSSSLSHVGLCVMLEWHPLVPDLHTSVFTFSTISRHWFLSISKSTIICCYWLRQNSVPRGKASLSFSRSLSLPLIFLVGVKWARWLSQGWPCAGT